MILLEFIFSSFWTFVGFLMILALNYTFIVEMIKAIKE